MPTQSDPTQPADRGDPTASTAATTTASVVGQVKKETTMNHGQFYKADQLVEAVHQEFLIIHQVTAAEYVRTYPDLTVKQIRKAQRVMTTFEQLLDEASS